MSNPSTYQIAVLAGDGIGPEVMRVTLGLLNAIASKHAFSFTYNGQPVGGIAIDATGGALPQSTVDACETSDAILFGSVGGPKWESLPPAGQPERAALLPLRKHFGLFANLRPSQCYPTLTHASPVKESII